MVVKANAQPSADQPCPGCGHEMSPAALVYHYPFAHWPRPQLIPDFYQRGDGIIRCLVTRDDKLTPWSHQETAPPTPASPAPHQPALL